MPLEGLRGLGFASRPHDLRPAAAAARTRSIAIARVFDACLRDVAPHMSSEDAFLTHPLHSWLAESILFSSQALHDAHRGDPQVIAARFLGLGCRPSSRASSRQSAARLLRCARS